MMGSRNMILVDDGKLQRLRARPSLADYTRQLWGRKNFILAEARGRALRGGSDTFLGKAWIVLDPLLQVLLYGLVFGLVLKTNRGIDNFLGFLTIGVVFYRLSTRGFATGTGLVQGARALITSFNFPRAAVVFSNGWKTLLDSIAPALVAVVVASLFQIGSGIHWQAIFVVPLFILMQFFNLGITFFVARITAFIPDMRTPISLITRALFFVSGIFFTIDRYAGHRVVMEIMYLNPIYQFLFAVRCFVLDGESPGLFTLVYLSAWSFGVAILGYVYFWSADERYANVQ